MSMELSEVDTEYILEHFKELNDGPFAELSSALRDLNKLPEVLAPAQPPLLPSQVLKNVKPFKRSTGRRVTTVVVATAIALTTTLGAAALTGVGSKPLVDFAKSTFKAIGSVGSSVIKIVSSPLTPKEQAVQQNDSALPAPLPTSDGLFNIEGDGVEKTSVEESKNQQIPQEEGKIAVQKVEKPNTFESHQPQIVPTAEAEHTSNTAEKTEVKSEVKGVEVFETKAPEKQEVKSSPAPIVKVTEKPEPKPSLEAKQSPQPVENKESSGEKDN